MQFPMTYECLFEVDGLRTQVDYYELCLIPSVSRAAELVRDRWLKQNLLRGKKRNIERRPRTNTTR